MPDPTPEPDTRSDDQKVCDAAQNQDWKFNTKPSSPLHHDNRWCPIHNPEHRPH